MKQLKDKSINYITHMKIIDIKLEKIKPFAKNNKIHSTKQVEMIANSIKEFGFKNPIIIDKNNEIIAGHGRYLAAQQLGLETAPCIVADDLTKEQVRAYRLLDNKIGDFGEYDMDNILEELGDIGDFQLGLDSLNDIFDNILPKEKSEAKEDNYEIPDEIKTDIQLGDLFEIGEHRLLCGDSTKKEDVEKLMNGQKADLGLTDPPYNLGYNYATYDDNLTSEEYNYFIVGFVNNLILYSEKQIITSGKQNVGYYYKNYDITEFAVWYAKNKMSGSRISNLGLCEPILFIGKFDRKSRVNDMFEYNVKQQKNIGGHTCPKIIDLFADIITSYSNKLVLDLFLGSGTTMVAAHQLKRKCYGMELDPKYCQVIIDRMLKLDPSLVVLKNGLPYK